MPLYQGKKYGEIESGDRCIIQRRTDSVVYVMIDAVGHGPAAKKVADIAQKIIQSSAKEPLPTLIAACEAELINTRGAVMFFAQFYPTSGKLHYYGVGNIRCYLISRKCCRSLSSYPGILGRHKQHYNLQKIHIDLPTSLLMFTDGLTEVKTQVIPQLCRMTPRHIVGFLSESWSENDDVCCFCEYIYE